MSNWERIREILKAVCDFDLVVAGEMKKLDLDVISPEAVVIYLLKRWLPIREMLDGLKKAGE